MKEMLKAIADIIYTNAINGAGAASVKGTYETQVPESLKKTELETKWQLLTSQKLPLCFRVYTIAAAAEQSVGSGNRE